MSGPRHSPLLRLAMLIAGLTVAVSANAEIVADTITIVTTVTTPPALVFDTNGTPHVAVASADGHRHFWKQAGVWQSETITTGGNPGFFDFAIGSTGRLGLLRLGGAGHLILHRPGVSSWEPDTIPAPLTPPSGAVMSLALDPMTDEALATWMTNTGGQHRLWIARRDAVGWSVVSVDSSDAEFGHPSIAITPTGQIRLAVLRNLGPNAEGPGLYVLEADTEFGPFVWSNADTTASVEPDATCTASLALDPFSAEPRVTYKYAPVHCYASRSAGVWTSQVISNFPFLVPPSMSLALDAIGRPRILGTHIQFGLTGLAHAQQECPNIATRHPFLLERNDAAGSDPFTTAFYLRGQETGPRALVMLGSLPYWVWRDSNTQNCVPAAIVLLHVVPPASVDPVGSPRAALHLAPNPLRSGGVLAVRLSVERAAPITLRIEDVAGRRAASREITAARGEASIAWTLPPLRAGWYRVTARQQGGATLGSASFLVIR